MHTKRVMAKRKLLQSKVVRVDELLELIGLSMLDDLANELESDKWVSKLNSSLVFKLILYSLLDSERLSLRVMEANYKSPLFKALEASAIGETAHSSLKDRLVRIDIRFFERLYEQSIKQNLNGTVTMNFVVPNRTTTTISRGTNTNSGKESDYIQQFFKDLVANGLVSLNTEINLAFSNKLLDN